MTDQTNMATQKLSDILQEFVEESDSIFVLLMNKDGTAITSAGSVDTFDTSAISALIAGMFSATREVARMVGEHEFSILLQQGKKRHIHISLVNESIMMAIVFEGFHRIGRIRFESRKVSRDIAETIIKNDKSKKTERDISAPQFKEVALNLIDDIFMNK